MKKSLLILTAFFAAFTINAQTRKTTAIHSNTNLNIYSSETRKATPACDSLKLDSASSWSKFYYTASPDGTLADGFAYGVSRDVDGVAIAEDANYYDASGTDYTYISGGLVSFAFANSTKNANLNNDIIFKIYDGLNGKPNNLLGSTTVKFSQAKTDVANKRMTEFIFASPIAVPANKIFYVSVDHSNLHWTNTYHDSLAIITDATNEAPAAAIQFITPVEGWGWIPVNDFWQDNEGNYENLNFFIFPYMNNSADGCTTLPVSLLNFKAIINQNNQPYLTWQTANEINNKGFEIERSKDGRNFKDIGFVSASSSTTKQINDYSYTDVSASDLSAVNYYRLKQIDNDGKYTYSIVAPVSLKNIVDWKIYPNPVKDRLTIELNLTAATKVNVQVLSKDGKIILNADKGTLPQGLQQLSINVNNIAAGSYFVRIKAGDKNYTQTIIKQ